MSIFPITAPHMEGFIIEAATKKRLFWIREHYFAKFHETSYNGCFQDNGYKWINGTINDIVRLFHPIGLRQFIIVKKAFI